MPIETVMTANCILLIGLLLACIVLPAAYGVGEWLARPKPRKRVRKVYRRI